MRYATCAEPWINYSTALDQQKKKENVKKRDENDIKLNSYGLPEGITITISPEKSFPEILSKLFCLHYI